MHTSYTDEETPEREIDLARATQQEEWQGWA